MHTSLSGGLVFADPVTEVATPVPCNLYTCALPEPTFRLSPACSLVVNGSPAPVGYDLTQIGITCVAHAQSERDAMAMLSDLRRIVRPGGRPFTHNPAKTTATFDPRGVIGVPHFTSDDADLWRFITIDIRAEIQPLNFGAGAGASAAGESMAQFDLIATVVPEIVPLPITLFTVYADGDAGVVATVTVMDNTLTLTRAATGPIEEASFDLTHADYDTIGELRAAVALVDHWHVGDIEASEDARPSVEILNTNIANAVGESNKARLRIHA